MQKSSVGDQRRLSLVERDGEKKRERNILGEILGERQEATYRAGVGQREGGRES